MSVSVSIVIPVWRDAVALRAVLDDPALAHAAEIIVATTDDEREEITEVVPRHVRIVTSALGRASQMNAGAAAASGTWLLFLHADSTLPAGWIGDIADADADPGVVGGAFRFALNSRDPRARFMEWGVRQRIRLFDLPYGDQGIFVRRSVFEALGGFACLPLMEDVDLVRRMRRLGTLRHSYRAMVTSARRWERDGWFRRMFTNWTLMTAYSAGVPPRRLARWYGHRRSESVAVLGRDPASPGKTRLWRALQMSPDPALAQALLADTVSAIERVPGIDRVLVHTGSRQSMAGYCPPGWTTVAQRGQDLGQRMACAFEELFGLGHERVVLVGSDLPTLPHSAVEQAFRLLRRGADVVLGPALDGGYYLIGMRASHTPLFERIDWGTPQVQRQTHSRALELGLTVRLVDPWYDVDDLDTLQRAASDPRAIHTSAWWSRHRPALAGSGVSAVGNVE